jgi:hypothetical protein
MAIAFLAVSLTVLMFDWAWVDIQTFESSQNIHLKMPVPLNLVSFALNFAPREEMQMEVPKEVYENKELILKSLQAIADCPDAKLVQVSTPDAKVLVQKKGERIVFVVEAEDATVHGAFPIEPIIEALEDWNWKEIEPKIAFDILSACRLKSYIHIDTAEAKVKISS